MSRKVKGRKHKKVKVFTWFTPLVSSIAAIIFAAKDTIGDKAQLVDKYRHKYKHRKNTKEEYAEKFTNRFPLVWLLHITPGIREKGQHCCDPSSSSKFASLKILLNIVSTFIRKAYLICSITCKQIETASATQFVFIVNSASFSLCSVQIVFYRKYCLALELI